MQGEYGDRITGAKALMASSGWTISELGGRSDGVQVMVNKGYAFVGHPFSGGMRPWWTSVIRAIRSR